MKRWSACVVPILMMALAVVVFAAEKPPEDYQRAMKNLGAFAQGAPKAVAAEDYAAITKFADSAKESFGVAETYWAKKGDNAAVKMAQDGGKGAADLGVASGLMSKDGSEYAVKVITDLCAGCHTAHREKAADGTFQIK